MNAISMLKLRAVATQVLAAVLSTGGLPEAAAQTQRNPVLEFCTGTWCQWCPCGDQVVHNVLSQHPNVIVLAYHGPANESSDPYSFFPGNAILGQMGFSGYPTGVVDRVTDIVSRNLWQNTITSRQSVPATVDIDMSRSYDSQSRNFTAVIDFTALENLSGQYNFNLILVEDGMVWRQTSNNTCTPGQNVLPNYVHEWNVRAMMNGALGEALSNGAWNQGDKITKIINYTVPVPRAPAQDIVPDSSYVVVKVYQVGTPLASNGEVQQAEKFRLVSDYFTSLEFGQQEALTSPARSGQFAAMLKNLGRLPDAYQLSLQHRGPEAWSASFTTPNETFAAGQTDVVTLEPGASANILIDINPNAVAGFGRAMLRYASPNVPGDSAAFRCATYGLSTLVVADGNNDYDSYMASSLENLGQEYGVVSSELVAAAGENLHSFGTLLWMTGLAEPGLTAEEQSMLANYLDHGGRLYLSGLDLAYQLADPSSPYYTPSSADFLANYLHAAYLKRKDTQAVVEGIAGDPISDGIALLFISGGDGASSVDPNADRYANQIDALGLDAAPVFNFYQSPNAYAATRAIHYGSNGRGRVVFTSFGFESISVDRDLVAQRILNWLALPTGVEDRDVPEIAYSFRLSPNYPNPFNPGTRIAYELPNLAGDYRVQLIIYNQLGQLVRTLLDQSQPAGLYELEWDGKDERGQSLSSGIYHMRLQYGAMVETRKLALLR